MEQKSLSKWLKIILAGTGVCALIVYLAVIPMLGQGIVGQNPDMANRYMPWLAFLWATGAPCLAALVLGWRIAVNIGKDRSFSVENAKLLKVISALAAGDAGFFLAGNVMLLLMNLSHPGVVLLSMLVVFAGAAVAVAAACLSRLVTKAAALQAQSDLTI